MEDREHLFDVDPVSLEQRLAGVMNDGARLVTRFTLWYTTRPAVYAAVIEQPTTKTTI